jgi:Fe2+ transport system protein FeoA
MGDAMTLAQLKIGQQARVKKIGSQGALRRRLLDLGITPNTLVKVVKVAPLGDPILISLRGFQLTLRKEEARHIIVERIVSSDEN